MDYNFAICGLKISEFFSGGLNYLIKETVVQDVTEVDCLLNFPIQALKNRNFFFTFIWLVIFEKTYSFQRFVGRDGHESSFKRK